jgi:hypothetical protein
MSLLFSLFLCRSFLPRGTWDHPSFLPRCAWSGASLDASWTTLNRGTGLSIIFVEIYSLSISSVRLLFRTRVRVSKSFTFSLFIIRHGNWNPTSSPNERCMAYWIQQQITTSVEISARILYGLFSEFWLCC